MDASETLAEYYDAVIERCNRDPTGRPNDLPRHDRIIYYVISTRCEIDMNGFQSVFDQLLNEDELQFVIEALNELDSPELAELFHRAYARLQDAGFFEDDSMTVSDLDEDAGCGFLDDIEDAIRESDALWELDDKLAALIPPNTT